MHRTRNESASKRSGHLPRVGPSIQGLSVQMHRPLYLKDRIDDLKHAGGKSPSEISTFPTKNFRCTSG